MQTPEPLDRDEALAAQRRQQIAQAVQMWSGQLVDLGGRNQLLFYRDLKVGTLDLADADPVAVDALMDGRTVSLSTLFAAEALPDRLKRARAIRNKSRESLEERGIVTCFLAVGMATWTNTVGTATPAAPILLREASIAAVGAGEDDFALALTGETDLNPTLVHLLEDRFAIEITDDVVDLIDEDRFDPQPVFSRLEKEAANVPGFAIAPRRVLGTFSYAKLPMVTDLTTNLDALLVHDVVAAIAGNRDAQISLSTSGQDVDITDPDRRPPSDEFLVLDADSSQSYAINAAVAGQSIVISGPPGTGKSQTIANLIATHVARGQSVLFVAEKRAAIAAVLDRLARVGLADLVLDLHDGAGSRRAIAEKLAAGLKAAGVVPRPDQSALHETLVDRRAKLNAYDAAVHRKRDPWDITVFEAQSELIGLVEQHGGAAETPVRLRGPELAALDAVRMRALRNELFEFAGLGGLSLTRADSLWVGAPIVSAEQAQSALDTASRIDAHTAPETIRALDGLLPATGLTAPPSVDEWGRRLNLLDRVEAVFARLRPEVFGGPIPSLAVATGTRAWRKDHPVPKLGWGARRRARASARLLWAEGGKPSNEQLHEALVQAEQVRPEWAAVATDGGSPRVPPGLADARGRFIQLTHELAALSNLVGIAFGPMSLADVQAAVASLARDERTLRKIPRLNELAAGLDRAGLAPLMAELQTRRPDPTMAVAMLDTCWYRSIIERTGFEDQVIATFDGDRQDSTAATFRAADADHIAVTVERVRRAAAEWLVAARDEHDDQSALVQAQAARKRGHLPLRQLFAAAPDVMTALKPCWAMSPLVVSQLLPGDRPYFDVVVFDEASQIVPADAIPAILRAHRVVVAGDRHQLPPTNFFSSATDGDEDEADAINADGSINLALTSGYESILDVLTAALGDGRSRSLTWHYRSRDERLIAFSNAWVYDHSLTTFPGIAGSDCLSHVLVDQPLGISRQEDSVTAEVERVVDLVLEHAAARPTESLGVITMGIKHADRIDLLLHERLRERPELHDFFDETEEEKFFVKNLERVQGDERDAIILSIGYGKSADGQLPYRFGPLLQDGGHRRLNVAITRARSRMTLVSSFSHHDMDPARSTAAGVQMLRAYLQYAASGGENLGDVALNKPALNPFEISVRDRLLAAGIPVTAQYGVAGYWIEFVAAHPTQPGRMVLAIEADGASYHSSPTARDRDRLRQEQLERIGWTFHRIWSADWFIDSGACVAKARSAYDLAVAVADARDRPAGVHRSEPTVLEPVEPAEPEVLAVPMPPAAPVDRRALRPATTPGRPITEYTDRDLAQLIRWIESDTLLRTEDQLFDAFVAELGFHRRGARIKAAFDRALPMARRTS